MKSETMSTDLTDQVSRIFERAKHEALALIVEAETVRAPVATPAVAQSLGTVNEKAQAQIVQYALLASKPYLTRKESAVYLGVSERSIGEWAARPVDQNPFPEE